MSRKKPSRIRRADPFYERELARYEFPLPSREYVSQKLADEGRPVTFAELTELLDIAGSERETFQRRLGAMEREGQLMRNRKGAYILPERASLTAGKIQGHPDGYGFLIPDDGSGREFLALQRGKILILPKDEQAAEAKTFLDLSPRGMEAKDGLGMDMTATSTSVLNGLPLFFGGIGCFAGGVLAKKLASKHGRISVARRTVGVLGLLASGLMIVVAVQMKNPVLAMLSLGVSGFFNDLSMPGAWGACMDIGGKLAGSVSGSMNMVGNLGGALGGVAVPWLMKSMGFGWHGVLYVAAATYAVSALCWAFINSDDRLHD